MKRFQKTPVPGQLIKVYHTGMKLYKMSVEDAEMNGLKTHTFGRVINLYESTALNRERVLLKEVKITPMLNEIDFFLDDSNCRFDDN